MPNSVNSLSIRCNYQKVAVDQEDLKPYWKLENIKIILLFISFSKTLLTTERRLTGNQYRNQS